MMRSFYELPASTLRHVPRYLEKSKDTFEEFESGLETSKIYSSNDKECWIEYELYDDVMWIRTAYVDNPKETTLIWNETKALARKLGCRKIQFTTKRNGRAWERLFKDMKVIQWKLETVL